MKVYSHKEIADIERTNWWYAGRRDLLAVVARKYFRRGGTALDLGCGVGSNLEIVRPHAEKIIGIDISEEALAYARGRGYDETLATSATQLPLSDRSVDSILCADVIEHVDDVSAAKEMFRVLRPGGRVLCTTPAFAFLWNENDDYGQHLRRYDRQELVRLFEKEGFRVLWVNYWNILSFFPMWVVARFYRRKPPGAQLENNLSRVPRWLNSTMSLWLRIESSLLRFPIPFGVSHILVAERPG